MEINKEQVKKIFDMASSMANTQSIAYYMQDDFNGSLEHLKEIYQKINEEEKKECDEVYAEIGKEAWGKIISIEDWNDECNRYAKKHNALERVCNFFGFTYSEIQGVFFDSTGCP